MESSILSEVDDTSILRTARPTPYGRPLNWLPASRLLPRAAGWSAATLRPGTFPTRGLRTESVGSLALSGHTGHTRRVNRAIDAKTHSNSVPRSIDTAMS